MNLNILWFVLIAVLFTGFFVLEGFDFGVGILLPFVAKTDLEKRIAINSIGPVWDGNEVWLITAGGAMFAAFPNWYATLFSGFYLALFLLLLALIARGVSFEFRGKWDHPKWRGTWDWMIFLGSIGPAFLWGVALANLLRGVPINAQMNYVGNFFTLLNPFALVAGVAMVLLFALHGGVFLSLKTEGVVRERAHQVVNQVGGPAATLLLVLAVLSISQTDIFQRIGVEISVIIVLVAAALLSVRVFMAKHREGWAFFMTAATIALSTGAVFLGLFPRVMVSSLNPSWSLTVYNAASNHYSLVVMSIVAATLLPVVLAYQAWTYWVFRKRVGDTSHLDY